eukprot:214078_1
MANASTTITTLLTFGFIRQFEAQLADLYVSNDIKHLICEYCTSACKFGTNIWDGQYTKLYNALSDLDLNQNSVKIHIPEFVFFGFQGCGKTSAISQATKLPLGVMKYGAGSRCPTRFRLIHNPSATNTLIKVNGETCTNDAELTNKILRIHRRYEAEDTFAKDIIEVRIESSQTPDLTLVDLPGLPPLEMPWSRGNRNYAKDRTLLEQLTTFFLNQQNADGSYRYVPVLVRKPIYTGNDHDLDSTSMYIDRLVDNAPVGRKRLDWRSDTLFIINQCDGGEMNKCPASSLIDYMQWCQSDGQTVFTMMNAKRKDTSKMTAQQLNALLWEVERDEEEKWNEMFTEFSKMDDECLCELKALCEEVVGIGKMNEIFASKMCDIVKKKTLPLMEQQLDSAIENIMMQIDRTCLDIDHWDRGHRKHMTFNNRFLQYLHEFYNGILALKVDTKYRKSWSKECDDFKQYLHSSGVDETTKWMYEIKPSALQALLRKHSNADEPARLLTLLRMDVLGPAAINRIIDAWVCMVASYCMAFPLYTDEDIRNVSGAFDATRQPELWRSVRNVVINSVGHISDATEWLGEMLRYKLKENADIIFEFGETSLDRNITTLDDYKAEVDCIINDFIAVAKVIPAEQATILDQRFCEETINNAAFIHRLLEQEQDVNEVGDRCDTLFYEALHGQNIHHEGSFGYTQYDIPLIRHLSYVFWTNIKHIATRIIIQKVSFLVMEPIKQHDDRVSNAIHCGVNGRQIQVLVNKLVDKTGVDVVALQQLIDKQLALVNDHEKLTQIKLGNEKELDLETLMKRKQEHLGKLNEIRKVKAQINTIKAIY